MQVGDKVRIITGRRGIILAVDLAYGPDYYTALVAFPNSSRRWYYIKNLTKLITSSLPCDCEKCR